MPARGAALGRAHGQADQMEQEFPITYGPFISRELAMERGYKLWFDGRPCKRGHIETRRVNPNACSECLRLQKRKPPATEAICEFCGRGFIPHVRSRKVRFCSIRCNANFNNRARSEASREQREQEEELLRWLPGYMPRHKAKELSLKHYFVGSRCPRGHVAPHLVAGGCSICATEYAREWRRQWTLANPKKARAIERARVRPRTDAVREREAANRDKNRERDRAYRRTYDRERNNVDPQYKLRGRLTSLVGSALKKQAGTKAAKTMDLIGCTVAELMEHLEYQFDEGMNWENRGREGWHVDHIRPCMSFDLTDPEQQKTAFNWRNLQPLWGKENISKSDRYDPQDEDEWVEVMFSLGFEGELFLVYA